MPKKGLKNQEKANEILTKTKEDLKKLDVVFKPPQNIGGALPYNENNRFEAIIGLNRLLELLNKTAYESWKIY